MKLESQMHLDGVEVSHAPIRPPRDGVLGEQVFTEHWAAKMEETEGGLLGYVMSVLTSEPSQRHATVAASFIQWLGSNVGRGFVYSARHTVKTTGVPGCSSSFLAAWGVQNARIPGLNGGFRAIEFVLAPADHFGGTTLGPSGLVQQPELTVDDYEAVEQVVRWLGTEDGRDFIDTCEAEISSRLAAERERKLQEFNRVHKN